MERTTIKIYRDLMGENEKWAELSRRELARHQVTMLNLIGSPGSGKTALLESMIRAAASELRMAVLEGDVETTRDAERIAKLGVPVYQLLTGGSCHLEAKLVHAALIDLPLCDLDLVVVENVGNMVCPAEFDIGEHAKIAVMSVTEGEDKPLKYPLLFRESKAVVLTKTDLLPYVPCCLSAYKENIMQVNGQLPLFPLSSFTGEGLDAFVKWVTTIATQPFGV